MRFLKTIQKKQSECPSEIGALDKAVLETDGNHQTENHPPELFPKRDLRIGSTRTEDDDRIYTLTESEHSDLESHQIGSADLNGIFHDPVNNIQPQKFTVEADRVNPHLVAITQPNSPYCEEFRSLRTQILHKSQKEKLQSIVIVSIGAGEGKSITALNLSWLLAQTSGISALLIDSDLRRPSLTRYLGIETETGLSDVLDGVISLTDSVIQLEPGGLYLLPGGAARTDVSEIISGAKFARILQEAYGLFDYVILDAPPLGIFTDASVLINQADGALLVVRANHTNYKNIDRILETLPRPKMLGAILNQSEETLIRENYYNYGYYRKDE